MMSKVITRGLKRQLELKAPHNLFMKQFNHKNNHDLKLREFNQVMLIVWPSLCVMRTIERPPIQ